MRIERSPGVKRFISLFAAAALGSASANGEALRRTIAITDVTIVDVEHGRSPAPRTVLIEAGRIAAIVAPADARIPADAERIDGRGKFLMPGLVDMHVHLFNTYSKRPPNDWAFPMFLANGVTGVREMSADAESLVIVRRWRSEFDEGRLLAPRILAAGIAVRGESPADAARAVDAAADAGADFIKMFSTVPAAHWRAILDAASRRGLPVAGHVPVEITLVEAAQAGQRSDEHLTQAYEACTSIESTLIDERRGIRGEALNAVRAAQDARLSDAFDAAACTRVGRALARSGQVQVPTLVLPWHESTVAPEVSESDPRWPQLRADEQARWRTALAEMAATRDPHVLPRWQQSLAIVAAFHRAGATVLAGTDAPMPRVYPGDSLHDELALLVQAGLTPQQALHAATLAPARFLGLEAISGTVAVGKRADLVLLDADPLRDIRHARRIRAVMLDGRLLRSTGGDVPGT
jgi:imidazolonepropionase-like amidohydrolase